MIGGIILLVLAVVIWFGMANPESAEEDSATGFMKVLKRTVGVKGYIIIARVLAVMCLLAAFAEFYKYFTT